MSTPRYLVTAGNTREMIDRVRDWGNIFTGNTGLAIAQALAALGPVDLLTSNEQHRRQAAVGWNTPHAITASGFRSHGELTGALEALLARQEYAGVFMTAAVADYAPAGVFAVLERIPQPADGGPSREHWVVRDVQADKVRGSHPLIAVLGRPTPKIIDQFRGRWGYRGLLVKFKLEVGVGAEELLRIGEDSRRASRADYLVANTLAMATGAGGEAAGAYLLGDAGHEWVPRADLPARLRSLAEQRL